MTSVQKPTGDSVSFRPEFRTLAVAAVLLFGGCSARAAVAVPAGMAQAASQEVASDKPDKQDKPDKKTTESENSKSSAQSDKPDESASTEHASKTELSSVETADERKERLEGELDSSLRQFDGLILKEQELLEEKREAAAAASGGGGSGGGIENGGEGESSEGTEGGTNDGAAADKSAGGTGGSPDTPAGEPAGGGGTDAGGDQGQVANGRVPPDVGDGHDDDIVARQLREAAMQEEDPALREKLWDEYRAYKFGTKKGTGTGGGDGSNKDKKKDNPT